MATIWAANVVSPARVKLESVFSLSACRVECFCVEALAKPGDSWSASGVLTRLCQALVKLDGVWTALAALRDESQLSYRLDQCCGQLFRS